ncbi:hypothetical protein PIB30_087216 [Stylosanthes scabra]|uniref:Uncharacterized protein n=1 Tax=Stylosanthes scabra TaxID=79078 RepID=A0ABU6QTW6_9FABA|nr:hypothetical protein [Stylosanthes scabra]
MAEPSAKKTVYLLTESRLLKIDLGDIMKMGVECITELKEESITKLPFRYCCDLPVNGMRHFILDSKIYIGGGNDDQDNPSPKMFYLEEDYRNVALLFKSDIEAPVAIGRYRARDLMGSVSGNAFFIHASVNNAEQNGLYYIPQSTMQWKTYPPPPAVHKKGYMGWDKCFVVKKNLFFLGHKITRKLFYVFDFNELSWMEVKKEVKDSFWFGRLYRIPEITFTLNGLQDSTIGLSWQSVSEGETYKLVITALHMRNTDCSVFEYQCLPQVLLGIETYFYGPRSLTFLEMGEGKFCCVVYNRNVHLPPLLAVCIFSLKFLADHHNDVNTPGRIEKEFVAVELHAKKLFNMIVLDKEYKGEDVEDAFLFPPKGHPGFRWLPYTTLAHPYHSFSKTKLFRISDSQIAKYNIG